MANDFVHLQCRMLDKLADWKDSTAKQVAGNLADLYTREGRQYRQLAMLLRIDADNEAGRLLREMDTATREKVPQILRVALADYPRGE